MKKLKAVLVVLFAMVFSLALFACGHKHEFSTEWSSDGSQHWHECKEDGEKNDVGSHVDADSDGKCDVCGHDVGGGTPPKPSEGDGSYEVARVKRVQGLDPEITDSVDQAAYDAMLKEVVVLVATDGEDVELTLDQCNVESNVVLQTVGLYTITITPKENNPDERSTTVQLSIVHDWGEPNTDGSRVCKHDKARLDKRTEDVVLQYGTFHEGTKATVPTDLATENGKNTVYSNANTSSALKPFGNVTGKEGSLEVPTITAGQLEQGMTITLRGKARTTTTEEKYWKHKNENWNSPSLGIADRTANPENPAHPGYVGGLSVIVREEGWVLYNGIGDTAATSTLAALMGGPYDNTLTLKNYGSHENATADNTPNTSSSYKVGNMPAPDSTDWQNFWVYSFGDTMPSMECYGDWVDIEYTWTYRDDGIIVITYRYNYTATTGAMELNAYIKVPDSATGYYDTILHGDYCDIKITESEVITLRTPTAFEYQGPVEGKTTLYYEGQEIDASLFNVRMKFEQTGDEWNDNVTISSSALYAYRGELTLDQLKEEANKSVYESTSTQDGWYVLSENTLSAKDTIYKIHLVRAGQTFIVLLNDAAGGVPFTVVENNIASAEGADVTIDGVTFANSGKVGAFSVAVAKVSEGHEMVLTLDGGFVQVLSKEQKTKLGATGNEKYIAIRLNGVTGTTKASFNGENVTAKAGTTEIPCKVVVDGDDAYIVLGLTEAGDVIITGLQGTPIHLVMKGLAGFNAYGEIEKKNVESSWQINAGGEVDFTYHVPANTDAGTIQLTMGEGGTPFKASGFNNEWLQQQEGGKYELDTGIYLKAIEYTASTGVLTLTVEFPAAQIATYKPIKVTLTLNEKVECEDYIHYEMAFKSDDAGVVEQNYYLYLGTDATKLYVAKALKLNDLKNGAGHDTLVLNLNNGNLDQIKAHGLLKIEYELSEGEVDILNLVDGVEASVTVIGTFGDSRDTDIGAIIVFEIDVTELGLRTEDTSEVYYVSVGNEFPETAPSEIIKVSTKVEKISVDATWTKEIAIISEGSCANAGLYAWAIKNGETVVFYAAASGVGGDHHFENGVCTLCGATSANGEIDGAWYGKGASSAIAEGEIVEFRAIYKTAGSALNGTLALLIEEKQGSATKAIYNMNGSGFGERADGSGDVWTHRSTPYAEGIDEFDTENAYHGFANGVITEEHPYNTINGVLNKNGEPIDGTTLNAAELNGTARYIVTFVNGTITVNMRLYPEGYALTDTPWFSIYFYITALEGYNYNILTMGQDGLCTFKDNNIDIFKYKAVGDDSTITAATVEDHATNVDGVTIVKRGVIGEAIDVAVSGAATKLGGGETITGATGATHFVGFKVTLAHALVDSTKVVLVDGAGKSIAGGVAKLAGDKKSVDVLIPINSASPIEAAVLDFTNFEASTLQADIRFDLTELAASDVVASISGEVNVLGGTVTLTFENAADTHNIVVGDTTKALSELANAKTEPVDLGSGLKVTDYKKEGTTYTLTVTVAAVDLTKPVTATAIRLQNGNNLLASLTVNPVKAAGTELEGTGWYVIVKDATLTLLTTTNIHPSEFNVTVNAGSVTDKNALEVSNMLFTLDVDNNVVFAEGSALSRAATAVYSKAQNNELVAIVIDLTKSGLNIEAATPYGILVSNATKYAIVKADRSIEQTAVDTGEKADIQSFDCDKNGIKGHKASVTETEVFYYDLEVTPAAHRFPADGGLCQGSCGLTGWSKEIEVGTKGTGTSGWVSTKEHGAGKAYDPADSERFGAIVKGQTVTVSGTLNAATMSVGTSYLNMHGVQFQVGGVWFRDDAWSDTLGGNSGTYAANNWSVTIAAKLYNAAGAEQSGDIWGKNVVQPMRASAQMTLVYDWSKDTEIKVTFTIVGTNGWKYMQTSIITMTGGNEFKDVYGIGISPEFGYFKGTIVVTGDADKVPATHCNPIVHVHDWVEDAAAHKCEGCGEYNPNVKVHTFVNGKCTCGYECPHANMEGKYCPDCQGTLGAEKVEATYTNATFGTWPDNLTLVYVSETQGIKVSAQYKDAGDAQWSGIVVQVQQLDGTPMYFIRPAGDYASGAALTWNAPLEGHTVTPAGFVADGDAATAYTALKKTAKTTIDITLAEGTMTITYKLYGEADAVTDTKTWTISGLEGDLYRIGIGNDTSSVEDGVKVESAGFGYAAEHEHAFTNNDHTCVTCGAPDPNPTHTYSKETDRCTCDKLNPNHGNVEEGGLAHNYTADGHKCTICGEVDPQKDQHHDYDETTGKCKYCDEYDPSKVHQHAYENGLCTTCGKVQPATGLVESGFTAVSTQNAPVVGFVSRTYESPVKFGADDGLTVGKKLIIVGSQTSAMAQNYHAVCWEVLAGYTGRADNYGWPFDPDLEAGDGVTAFGTVTSTYSLKDVNGGNVDGDIWAYFKKLGAAADWRVEFDYKSAEQLVVTVTLSNDSWVYNCVYTCPITKAAMVTRFQTIWIGAEAVTNLTVSGYKLV